MKLFWGILFILAGLVSIQIEIPYIWTGGIIVGFALIIQGVKQKNEQNINREMFDNQDEVLALMSKRKTNDEIAEHLFETKQIPPLYTNWLISNMIWALLKDGSTEEKQMATQHIMMNMQSAISHPPKECIEHFTFKHTVFSCNDHINLFTSYPNESSMFSGKYTIQHGYTAEEIEICKSQHFGILVLHKEYLFFFKQPVEEDNFAEAIINEATGNIPFSDWISSGKGLIDVLHNELPDYFSKSRITKLYNIYENGDCIVYPLSEIVQVTVTLIGPKYYVAIDFYQIESINKIWIIPDKIASKDPSWAKNWVHLIKMACLNIGKCI